MSAEQPLSYWIALACIGFEEDLYRFMEATEPKMTKSDLARAIATSPQYVSKLFNGSANYTLETMAKLGRAVNAILQVRLVLEGREVVRVVDFETAALLDDLFGARVGVIDHVAADAASSAKVLRFKSEETGTYRAVNALARSAVG